MSNPTGRPPETPGGWRTDEKVKALRSRFGLMGALERRNHLQSNLDALCEAVAACSSPSSAGTAEPDAWWVSAKGVEFPRPHLTAIGPKPEELADFDFVPLYRSPRSAGMPPTPPERDA